MQVNLKLDDDAELRNYVKQMIRGQILSITREEILAGVAGVVPKGKTKAGFIEGIMKEEIALQVRAYVNRALVDFRGQDLARQMIREEVEKKFTQLFKSS